MSAATIISGFVVVLGVLAYWQHLQPRESPLEPSRSSGRVLWVYDGDTLKISPRETRLRLWGVDAPEKGESGADAARAALIRMTEGKRISFIEIDRDRYGRTVARVFLADGREINRMMIESGTAREYCRYSKGFYGQCDR